ncbi:MAG: phosphohistidine phosphatase SixA [Pseudomonadota bacterium]
MELIFWRHAEAEEGANDLARALTAKGEKQAKRMAGFLNARLPASARILVSPAVRTQQTASALGRAFETVDAIAPGAEADAVLKAAGWPRAEGTVLIVGHQPTLGEAAALLLQTESGLSVRKGAVWWFASRARGGREQAVLRTVIDAETL